MTKKAVWLVIGGLMMAGCASSPNMPTASNAQMAPTQNTYRVLGGTPTETPTAAPEVPTTPEVPTVPTTPVVPAVPCIDCGPSLDGVLAGYNFNIGNGIPFGYRDVLYDISPWARGFGLDYLPCVGCPVPVAPPVVAPAPGKNHKPMPVSGTRMGY